MIFEIRNYHFHPARFAAYKEWARGEAIPYLARELDLVGFWANADAAPELRGHPHDELGTANLTWIIRWRDLDQRNEVLPRVFATPEWEDIFSRVPGGLASYLRIEAKFAEALS
jgi:NIPSNAP protein